MIKKLSKRIFWLITISSSIIIILKVSKKRKESGIIANYIYKTRKMKENSVNVMLIENEEAISHSRKIIETSVIISAIALVIIYLIAKKNFKIYSKASSGRL